VLKRAAPASAREHQALPGARGFSIGDNAASIPVDFIPFYPERKRASPAVTY
jgi:hypothetical protein